jgi:hypothetical protein
MLRRDPQPPHSRTEFRIELATRFEPVLVLAAGDSHLHAPFGDKISAQPNLVIARLVALLLPRLFCLALDARRS